VDKKAESWLREHALALGVEVSPAAAEALLWLQDELLRWNQKMNLTAIRDPAEVLEKHLLDSLSVVPVVPSGAEVLDVGSGAGFPGLPLAVVRSDVRVTLVDAVAKKVGFIKAAAARLKMGLRVRTVHCRLAGDPAREGLLLADVAVSRALMDLPAWLTLARGYVKPGGRVVAMLGEAPSDAALHAAGAAAAVSFAHVQRFALPQSHARRAIAVFHVERSSS
jgi:16S rRNA (guanine527-N7)-methyltransferase